MNVECCECGATVNQQECEVDHTSGYSVYTCRRCLVEDMDEDEIADMDEDEITDEKRDAADRDFRNEEEKEAWD